ncbi:hypothetical protein AAHC03_021018 [Spirometra sp. Aus1]
MLLYFLPSPQARQNAASAYYITTTDSSHHLSAHPRCFRRPAHGKPLLCTAVPPLGHSYRIPRIAGTNTLLSPSRRRRCPNRARAASSPIVLGQACSLHN